MSYCRFCPIDALQGLITCFRFKSRKVMEAWYSSKAFEEGLIEEGWEARYCSRIIGTREWE